MSLLFNFEGRDVRIAGQQNNLLFVVADVCRALALTDPSKACEGLASDEKGTSLIRTLGGEQQMLCVTEAGLYRLIFRSRKAEAERFRRWVFHEVLPQIRQTGAYAARGLTGERPVERLSVLVFLTRRHPDTFLSPQMLQQFGTKARVLAKALGVRGVVQTDDLLGEALAFPVPFLERLAEVFPAPRLTLAGAGGVEDTLGKWARHRLELAGNEWLSVEALFSDYQAWCRTEGIQRPIQKLSIFGRCLLAARPELRGGWERRRMPEKRVVGYVGVKLASGEVSCL